MQLSMPNPAWLIAGLLWTTSCGGGSQDVAPADVPAELAALVPQGASGYLHLPSLDALGDVSGRFAQATGMAESPAEEIENMLAASLDLALVRRDRPLAIVFDFEAMAREGFFVGPFSALLVPTDDAEALRSSLKTGERAADAHAGDGYLAVPLHEGYAPGGAPGPLTEGLPAGDVSLRLDLGAVIEAFRPMLETSMDEARTMLTDPAVLGPTAGFEIGPMMDWYLDLSLIHI